MRRLAAGDPDIHELLEVRPARLLLTALDHGSIHAAAIQAEAAVAGAPREQLDAYRPRAVAGPVRVAGHPRCRRPRTVRRRREARPSRADPNRPPGRLGLRGPDRPRRRERHRGLARLPRRGARRAARRHPGPDRLPRRTTRRRGRPDHRPRPRGLPADLAPRPRRTRRVGGSRCRGSRVRQPDGRRCARPSKLRWTPRT
jgi:hypothetical protein